MMMKHMIDVIPDGIRHSVRPESTHHAQLLQRSFVLPLLGKFLLLRALAFHEFLPAFGRAFDIAVEVPELFHVGQGLHVKTSDQYGTMDL